MLPFSNHRGFPRKEATVVVDRLQHGEGEGEDGHEGEDLATDHGLDRDAGAGLVVAAAGGLGVGGGGGAGDVDAEAFASAGQGGVAHEVVHLGGLGADLGLVSSDLGGVVVELLVLFGCG